MEKIEVPVYNMSGEKVGGLSLAPAVFGEEWNSALVHQVVEAQRASSRPTLAHTKGRGDVRGGGKKPWRQKGTGRARHGSTRSPIWKGGGVVFGPTKERNFSKRINKKMKVKALRMVLSDKVKNERFVIVDAWAMTAPKTKEFATILSKLPIQRKKATLVTTPADAGVIRASRNIPRVTSIGLGSLNVVDLLSREYLVMPKQAVADLEKRLSV